MIDVMHVIDGRGRGRMAAESGPRGGGPVRVLRHRQAAWPAGCGLGWLLCVPFAGPGWALLGALPALVVFHPGVEALGCLWRHRRVRELLVVWSWRRLLEPVAVVAWLVAALLTVAVVTVVRPVAAPPFGALLVVMGGVFLVATALVSGLHWRYEGSEGSEGSEGPEGSEGVAGGAVPELPVPEPPVGRWALLMALAFGGFALAAQAALRIVIFTPDRVAPAGRRLFDVLDGLDGRIQGSFFGPSFEQPYWPALVAGAGLFVGGGCALLRRRALGRTPGSLVSVAAADAVPFGRVFLSYARSDSDTARAYVDALKARGQDVWVDWQDIQPSAKWRAELVDAIRGSEALVVLVSARSLASPYCRDECLEAVRLGKPVLPVVIDPELGGGTGGKGISAALRAAAWGELTEYQRLTMYGAAELDAGVRATLAFTGREHEWVALHRRLGEQAHAWRESEHSPALLLSAPESAAAQRWRERTPAGPDFRAAPTEDQLRFIDASRKALAGRTRRLAIGAVAAAVALASVGALVSATQSDARAQRRAELSRDLAAAARAQPYPGLDRAALLSAAAYGQADTAEARQAMLAELLRTNHVARKLTSGFTRGGNEYLAYSANGAVLALSRGGDTELWDTRSWTRRATVRGTLPKDAARALSADGSRVVVGEGPLITVFDTRGRGSLGAARLDAAPTFSDVWYGGISPDGKRVVASGGDGSTTFWELPGKPDGTLARGRRADCFQPSLSRGGDAVWCSVDGGGPRSDTGTLRTFDGARTVDFPGRPRLQGWTARDEPVVTLSTPTQDRRRWRPQILGWGGPSAARTLIARGEVEAVSPDGRRAALTRPSGDGGFEVWDLLRRRPLGTVAQSELAERGLELGGAPGGDDDNLPVLVEAAPVHGMPVAAFDPVNTAVLHAPDGRSALAASTYGLLAWHLDGRGRLVSEIPAEGLGSTRSALTPDGRTLATPRGERLLLHDVRDGRRRASARLDGEAGAVAFSPDGKRVAVSVTTEARMAHSEDMGLRSRVEVYTRTGAGRTEHLRRTATLTSPSPPDPDAYHPDLTFSPDGERLFLAEAPFGVVREWSVRDGKVRRTYGDERAGTYLDGMALAPDGRTLATADRAELVRLWDTGTGAELGRLPGAGGRVAFSPDGRRIVTNGQRGGGARVWDVATRTPVGPERDLAPAAGEQVSEVQFTPDGRSLLVTSSKTGDAEEPGELRLWDLTRRTEPGPVLATVAGGEVTVHVPKAAGARAVAAGRSEIVTLQLTPSAWRRSLCTVPARWFTSTEWQHLAPGHRYPRTCGAGTGTG